jgi:hypothetical protein
VVTSGGSCCEHPGFWPAQGCVWRLQDLLSWSSQTFHLPFNLGPSFLPTTEIRAVVTVIHGARVLWLACKDKSSTGTGLCSVNWSPLLSSKLRSLLPLLLSARVCLLFPSPRMRHWNLSSSGLVFSPFTIVMCAVFWLADVTRSCHGYLLAGCDWLTCSNVSLSWLPKSFLRTTVPGITPESCRETWCICHMAVYMYIRNTI